LTKIPFWDVPAASGGPDTPVASDNGGTTLHPVKTAAATAMNERPKTPLFCI
jgi:hypothetical protein